MPRLESSASERSRLNELIDEVMEPYWSDRLVPPRQRSTAVQGRSRDA
jgi:hypothetical protein